MITQAKITNFAKRKNIELDVTWWDDEIWLNKLIIPEEHRGEGLGTKVLDMLKEYCDEKGIPMKLLADSCYGTELNHLIKFYKKHGFESYKEEQHKRNPNYLKYTPKNIDK